MRNLTKTLAVVSLLIPASAYPLGVGEIKLHSALNQNLDAEISLVLLPGEKVSDIKVNLAPPDKFDDIGVPWSYYLSKIKFEPVNSNGSAFIKISSSEALKEPFLNFLLEVSWPKGTIYREFTVLVDPPDVYKQAAIPVISSRSDDFESSRGSASERRRLQGADIEAEGNSAGVAGQYGPTSKNDTLWKIAEQVRSDSGVSIEQMLIALYQANPQAFYKANINALLAGKKLKIPDKDAILKYSRKQAANEFNRQIREWKNSAVANIATRTEQKTAADNQLTLLPPAQESASENSVVSSEHAQQPVSEKKIESPSSETAPVDNEIKAKISALEKQLAVMQELIALKDQQLAALQNQSQQKPAVQVPAEQQATPSDTTTIKDTTAIKPDTTVASDAAAIKPTVEAPDATVLPKPETIVSGGDTSVTKPVEATPGTEVVTKPVQTKPLAQQPVAKPAKQAISSKTAEDDADDWYYLSIGGIGSGLLIVLGWLWWRQRKLENEDYSVNSFTAAAIAKANKYKESFSEPTGDNNYDLDLGVGENIFATDFASADFDVIDMDQGEIDPVSEADVYLAYGRYKQAEDLMRDAISEQPERDECKLKLLEIFYANGNKQAFEKYAGELHAAGKEDDIAFWAKVTEMGSEICPDSSMFSFSALNFGMKKNVALEGDKPGSAVTNNVIADEAVGDMEFDLASFEELFDSNATHEMFGGKNDLFDLDITSAESKPQITGINDEPKQNNESIDFDLSLFAADNQPSAKTIEIEKPRTVIETSIETKKDEFDSFDFNMGLSDDSTAAATEENYHTIDFSLDKEGLGTNIQDTFDDLNAEDPFSFEEDSQAVDFSQNESPGLDDKALSGKKANISDAFDDFDFNMPINDEDQKGFGISDLAEMDEMETRLDLAIAYIDMGDVEAAKEIALEVLNKGTKEQQMVAKALLAGM